MKATFKFPDIGEGLEEGIVQEWLVEVGQHVELDTPLVTVETDKVVTDLPSPYRGRITKLMAGVGDEIHVGQDIVEFELEGENHIEQKNIVLSSQSETVEEDGAGVVGQIEVAGENDVLPASTERSVSDSKGTQEDDTAKVLATPVVRAMAKHHNVNLSDVKGSGSQGRVMKEDVQNHLREVARLSATSREVSFAQNADVSVAEQRKPISSLRKTIAANILQAQREAAHVSVFDEVEITQLESIRQEYKSMVEAKGAKLTYASFVVKAVSMALLDFPVLNARFDEDAIVYSSEVHMGMAVDTDRGLVVPVLRHTEQKSIARIALEIQACSEKARQGLLTLDDMRGGTFTITSFGSIGGRFGTPILNRPQSAILGIGRVAKQAVVVNDEVTVGLVMPLSLTVDHCIVDGGESSRFLSRVMRYLENPMRMVVGE